MNLWEEDNLPTKDNLVSMAGLKVSFIHTHILLLQLSEELTKRLEEKSIEVIRNSLLPKNLSRITADAIFVSSLQTQLPSPQSMQAILCPLN